METSTAAPPAGWFPDPGDARQERWWSGAAWTEHARPAVDAEAGEPLVADAASGFVFETGAEAPAVPAVPAPERPRLPTFDELLQAARPRHAVEPGEVRPSDGAAQDAPSDAAHVPDAGSGETGAVPSGGASVPAVSAVPSAQLVPSAPPVPPTPPVPDELVRAVHAPASTFPAHEFPAPELPPPSLPAPASAAPLALSDAPATPTPSDGFIMPSDHAPSNRDAPLPGFALPGAAATAPDGFVLPSASASLVDSTDSSASSARPPGHHALEAPPAPAAPPAAAPVGFTSSADPEVANRYRAVISAPHADASAPPVLAPPPPAGAGWAPTAQPVPHPFAPAPAANSPLGYAPAPAGGVAFVRATGRNRAAKLALSTGISSLGALVFMFFGRILIVPSLLSLVAIVAGIVGLVVARRAGVGKWPALGGLLMGIATSITLTVNLVVTVLGVFAIDAQFIEDDIVANAAPLYGVDIVSANCPDDVSLLTSTSFTCTAFDSGGGAYAVAVELTSDGYLEWDLQL